MNDFYVWRFVRLASVRMRSQHNFCAEHGFGRSPTSVFEVGFVKSDSKIVSWYQLTLLATIMLVLKGSQPVSYTDAQT